MIGRPAKRRAVLVRPVATLYSSFLAGLTDKMPPKDQVQPSIINTPQPISTIRLVLPLLALFAIYALFVFSTLNGFFFLLQNSIANRKLPDCDEPLRTNYTGIGYLDYVLTNLGPFFWPAISGNSPGMSVYLLGLLGPVGAAWVLLNLEGWRRGNAGKLVALQVLLQI